MWAAHAILQAAPSAAPKCFLKTTGIQGTAGGALGATGEPIHSPPGSQG